MNKLLRYSFIAVMALVSSLSFGATVIFSVETDKGTQEKADVAGDQVTKDGITIKTTKGNSAFAALQYRFAKSSTTTFSSTVGNITKVEITSTAQGTKKYGPGCFTDPSAGSYAYSDSIGTWTGDAASFTLTASIGQVRATRIVVTYTPSGETPEEPTQPEQPEDTTKTTGNVVFQESFAKSQGNFTVDYLSDAKTSWKINESIGCIAASGNLDKKNTATESRLVSPVIDLTGITKTTLSFSHAGKFFKNQDTERTLWVKEYGAADWTQIAIPNSFSNKDWTFVDNVVDLSAYDGKKIQIAFHYVSTAEAAGKWEIKNVVVRGEGGTSVVDDKGTEANPYTPSEVLALVTLPAGDVYVKGKVVSYTEGDDQYKNASYYISDDGTASGRLQVYHGKYVGGGDFTSELALRAGDEVVVKGTITEYNNNKEIATGSSIVTINGGTDPIASEVHDPDAKGGENNPYTPAEALALTTLPQGDVYVSGIVVADVAGSDQYGNADYFISADGSENGQIKVFRGKWLGAAKFTSEQQLKKGDRVVVKGQLTVYQNVNQIAAGSELISVNGETTAISNVLTNGKNADGVIYNLAGQRVGNGYKGIVIINGKKYIRK